MLLITRPFFSRVSINTSVAAIVCLASQTLGAPITVPGDLNLGDHYRLVFITSSARNATSANIDVYNSFVASVASSVPQLAALGTTWKAIGSTPTVAARDNTNTNPAVATGFPIYDLGVGNLRVANDNVDLWDGSIGSEGIRTTETGDRPIALDPQVFTGTAPNGSPAMGTALGEMPEPQFATVGRPFIPNSSWVSFFTEPNPLTMSFLAISGVLTVGLSGDFNEDGFVNGADLQSWTNGFGTARDATHMQGDADGDGDADGADFLAWQQQFGGGPGNPPTNPVPEPASLALTAALAIAVFTRRRQLSGK